MSGFRALKGDTPRLLKPDGTPFFILGVNYEGYFDRPWHMWEEEYFDLELIEKDLKKAQQVEFNVVRAFVQKPLMQELGSGNFDKLDMFLELASRYGLYVMLTLNDAHSTDLSRVGDLNGKIAERYKDHPAIMAYDLENEPKLYHLLVATYPEEYPAPIHSTALVDHYGEKVSRDMLPQLLEAHRIPSGLDDDKAYYYANALEFFLALDGEYGEWHKTNGGTLVDYVRSEDSAHWGYYLEVMSDTVAAWIAAQSVHLKETDPDALITVGYDWTHFAMLPANEMLDFQEFHIYSSASYGSLGVVLDLTSKLVSLFPQHPFVIGEFGYSNDAGYTTDASKPVSQSTTSLYEGAVISYLRANNLNGGIKWMLNDVTGISNPFEANLGVYTPDGNAKVVAEVFKYYSDIWQEIDAAGEIAIRQDTVSGLGYVYNLPGVRVVGGAKHQDLAVEWNATEGTHLFAAWGDNITFKPLSQGDISVKPSELISDWADYSTIIYRLDEEGKRVKIGAASYDERAKWTLQAHTTYVLARGAQKPTTPPAGEVPEPGPGEHVVILPDADEHLDAARGYLRQFLPEVSFDPESAEGRWPYVTIVGDTTGVSAAQEQALRDAGAWVERISADSMTALKNILDGLAEENRRFLEGEEPETPTPTPPPTTQTYVVQPGDTLWTIAVKSYGDGKLWTVIYEANRDILDSPGKIRPGQELKIPSIS